MKKPLYKILVVDDDEDVLVIVRFCLESNPKLQIKTVTSGKEAIEAAREMNPDMILLDVMMPGMDGIETLRALKLIPSLSHIPVAFLTAKAQKKEIEDYLRLGACEVIVKPFDPLTFPSQLQSVWEKCQ